METKRDPTPHEEVGIGSRSLTEPPADLGVLLVHGIGEQRQGETLTKFAEPIVEWIRDWLQREATGDALIASAPLDASLRPPLLAPDTPAHAYVMIGAEREGKQQVEQWLFAEAWWAPQVLTPPISDFTAWLLTRGPWLLLFHLNQGWLSSERTPTPIKVLIGIGVSLAWSLLSLLANVVLTLVSLIALVPIGRLRRGVYELLRSIAGVLGDAYVLLRSPVQGVAFERATQNALDWLRPRCRKLAVIAHSQGAAIAHRTLQRADAPHADLLITVGAGITKLEALRYFERLNVADSMAALLAPPFLLAAAVAWLRTRALGLSDAEVVLVAPIALGIIGASMLMVSWLTVRQALAHLRQRSDRVSLAKSQPALHWVDIVATHDPVPAGELTRFFELPGVVSSCIPVLRSRVSDHTSYWGARASFIPAVVEPLAGCAESALLRLVSDDRRFAAAQRTLTADLRVLRAVRMFDIFAVLLPFFFARTRLDANVEWMRARLAAKSGADGEQPPLAFITDTMSQFEQALRWIVHVVAGTDASWARQVTNGVFIAVSLVCVIFLWQRLTFAIWCAWSASRNEEVLRRRSVWRGSTLQDRLNSVAGAVLIHGGFTGILLLPFFLSVTWSTLPGWLDETRIYWIIGKIAAALFALTMVIGLIGSFANSFDEVSNWLRDVRKQLGTHPWAAFYTAVSRGLELLFVAFVLWLILGTVVSLPVGAKASSPVVGVLVMLRALIFLLDRIWQRLASAGAAGRGKAALLMLPPTLGIIAATGLAFAVQAADIIGLASIASVVSLIVASLTLLVLRLRVIRFWKHSGRKAQAS
jgi:hypothetical protein